MTNTPYEQGSQAFMNEQPTSDCEFASGSTRHREWISGWSRTQATERAHRAKSIAALFVGVEPVEKATIMLKRLVRPITSRTP